jgi:acetyl-CoA C-acetyltransferase
MGRLDRAYNARYSLTREEQDAFAARSHQLAARPAEERLFDDEIVPVEIPQRKGDPIVFADDEGDPRRHDRRVARQAAPGVRQGRHDHRGLASQISDGACAVVVMSKAEGRGAGPGVARRDRRPRRRRRPGRLAAGAAGQRDPQGLRQGGDRRVRPRPRRDQRGVRRGRPREPGKLGSDPDKVNVNGGAIALGHPVGMSGARIPAPRHELKRRGGGVGAAALCGGGGQGDALIIRVPPPDRVTATSTTSAAGTSRRSSAGAGRRAVTPRAVARLISLVEDAPRAA